MIEDVENFPAELDSLALTQRPVFERAQVDVLQTGSVENAATGVSRGEGQKAMLIGRAVGAADAAGNRRKGGGIKPRIVHTALSDTRRVIAGGDSVRPRRFADGRIDSG